MPEAKGDKRLPEEIGRKAERKLRARRQEPEGIWYWLGMFGLVGWSVAVPTLIGVAAGVWLDRNLAGSVSWTLTLLLVGLALGCLNAWYWVQKESREGPT